MYRNSDDYLDLYGERRKRSSKHNVERVSKSSYEDLIATSSSSVCLTSGQISRLAISLHLFLSDRDRHSDGPVSTRKFLQPILQILSLCTADFECHDAETQSACLWLFNGVIRYIPLGEQMKVYEESGLENQFSKLYTVCLEKIGDFTHVQDIYVQALCIWLGEQVNINSTKSTQALKVLGACSSKIRTLSPLTSLDFIPDCFSEQHIADHTLAWLLALNNSDATSSSLAVLSGFAKVLSLFSNHPKISKTMLSRDIVETLYSGLSTFFCTKRDYPAYGIFLVYLYTFRDWLPLSLVHCKNVLRNGLLGDFARKYLLVSQEPQADKGFLQLYVSHVSALFQPFLVFGSAIEKILLAIDKLSPSVRQSLTRNESMSKAWQRFELLVVERTVAFCLFTAHRLKGVFKCSNPNCEWRSHRRFLMRCSKCEEAAYCSKLCQRTHWHMFEHHAQCRVLSRLKHEREVKLIRDRSFIIFLAAKEVQRRLPLLRKLASTKLPNTPFDNKHVGFRVNLCRYPMSVDAFELPEPQHTTTTLEGPSLCSAKPTNGGLATLSINLDERFNVASIDALVELNMDYSFKKSSSPRASREIGESEITPELIDRLSRYIVRSWKYSDGRFRDPWSFSSVDAAIKKLYRDSQVRLSVKTTL